MSFSAETILMSREENNNFRQLCRFAAILSSGYCKGIVMIGFTKSIAN